MAKQPTTKQSLTTEIGSAGLKHSGGFINEEFLPQLRGTRGRKVYREMAENDPTCGAVLFAMSMMLRQVEWTVTPAVDDEAGEEAAEFVRGALFEDMSHSWPDFINDVCTMFESGFAPFEIVWKKRNGPGPSAATRSRFEDGLYAPRKLALRPQDTIQNWLIDEDGGIGGVCQYTETGERAEIHIERLLLFRTDTARGNPEGRSVLRAAYRPWYFKKRVEEIEGVGMERDLAGYPILKVPERFLRADANAEDKAMLASFQKLITQIRRDKSEGAVLPSSRDDKGNAHYELELLSSGGTRQFDTVKIRDGYARDIAMSVLADFIFLGQKAVGSFALSSDKTELFATALGGFNQSIASVLNRHLLPRWWSLNGMDRDYMPRMTPGDIEREDVEKVVAGVVALAGAGAQLFPDRGLENRLRKLLGLPELADEDEDEGEGSDPGQRPPNQPADPVDEGEGDDAVEDGGR